MTIEFELVSLSSNAGDEVSLPRGAVTAVVGGNNVGKSQLLRDIRGLVHQNEYVPVTISALTVVRPVADGDEEIIDWLDGHAARAEVRDGTQHYAPRLGGGEVGLRQFKQFFNYPAGEGVPWMGPDAEFFLHSTTAGALAGYATGSAPTGGTYAAGALAHLYRDGDLESELNALTEGAFGVGILLDRANTDFRLRVGKTTVPVPPLNHPTRAYADALLRLPTLDSQGDGMRSFIGLCLLVMSVSPGVLLVDEPEAFLHPGQARALGRWLGESAASRGIQIVIATHDRDLLLGLLEASAPVNVVRVAREGGLNRMSQLSPSQVREVWNDPVLRYSNLLQGLFHNQVVICEGDADCRFYGAALEDLAESTERRARADDVLFVPSGGKSRIASMADSLRHIKVSASVITDFDILRTKADIKGIVEAVGAAWTDQVASDFRIMAESLQSNDLWSQAKSRGIVAVPAGPPTTAVRNLLATLSSFGIHVVPMGEMEGFDRTESVHGAAWVSNALESGVHRTDQLHSFLEPILSKGTP
ncbi:AAA family ATPase [Cryobacterium ruanii]|uniref:ATP-binding protein n=1 Tax=Cryobacterium ruanii TaxID=1259197 RepID=A0A4R9AQI1_9MICO|nr:AAA family ATPase [Cryobacterium ruanii]TFD67987.1 ATP-binding protein [Cryobacterium ruanii]